MIVITGGAGFIGSALAWELNRRGRTDLLLVDRLGTDQRWRNLVGLQYEDYLDRDAFIAGLEGGMFDGAVDAVLHLGACSTTTEVDAGYLMENNYRYTLRIGRWWERNPSARFVYASSAATYGTGEHGYIDDEEQLDQLRPLNMYGYSKHLFDLQARRRGWLDRIVGLKYFNVYGPNEYHKGGMRSVICRHWHAVRHTGSISLFASGKPSYADGEQARDFVYVKDAVAMTLWFLDHPGVGGVYNVGTGTARTWNDYARALFAALDLRVHIDYVPMPEQLSGTYQYFTQADTGKLRGAGCTHECMSLESAVDDYVRHYLVPGLTLAGEPVVQ